MRGLGGDQDVLREWTLGPQGIWIAGVYVDDRDGRWRLNLMLRDARGRNGRFTKVLGPIDDGPDPTYEHAIAFTLDNFYEDTMHILADQTSPPIMLPEREADPDSPDPLIRRPPARLYEWTWDDDEDAV